jgi:hypothetical protein
MFCKLVLLFALVLGPVARAATDEETLHLASHFGLSYALNTVAYGLTAKTFKMSRANAFFVAAASTFLIGAVRQVVAAEDGPVNTRGLWQNALGIAAFTGTALVFEF